MNIVCIDYPQVAVDFNTAQLDGTRRLLQLGLKTAYPLLRERVLAAGIAIISVEFGEDDQLTVGYAQCLNPHYRRVIINASLEAEVLEFFLALAEVIFPDWRVTDVCGSFAWRLHSDTIEVHHTPSPDEDLTV